MNILIFFVLQFSGSLLNISCIFLTCAFLLFLTACIIFTIITLNSFSHRVPFSSSFIWSYGSLPYSFTGNIFHCCFILSNLLCLWSPFFRFQSWSFSFSSLPMVDKAGPAAWVDFMVGETDACTLVVGAESSLLWSGHVTWCALGCLYCPEYFFFQLCQAACRILVPQPGIKRVSPASGAQSLHHWTTREVPALNFR